jgi:amidase
VDRETREICTRAVRQFKHAGCVVEEAFPEFGPVEEVFLALRSQQFVVDRELQIAAHRDSFNLISSGTPSRVWRKRPAA